MPVLRLVIIKLKLKAKNIDIAIIGIDIYYIAYFLKKAQISTISISDT